MFSKKIIISRKFSSPDTAKTGQGFLNLKAYRLTPKAIKMFKEGDFSPDAVKDLHVSYGSLFTEIPIIIKNSHLVNALMVMLLYDRRIWP